MATAAEIVTAQFAQAQNYASAATASLSSFTAALDQNIYAPPTISVTWNAISAPTLPTLPAAPTLPTIAFEAPIAPGAFAESAPNISLDGFTEAAPTTTFPTAPTLSYGSTPTIPTVASVSVPTAPTVTLPDAPTYLTLNVPTFAGIDLRPDLLAQLETIPTLNLVAPTPYSYAPGPNYASTLLTALQTTLAARINGGTGLPVAVETAIWDRARDREAELANANIAEVTRTADALGFQLPPGVLAAQVRQAQQTYYDKTSGVSRDIAIKQAELEQANLKDTIAAGIELERQLIDYSFRLEQLTFESAKATADNAIQVYNAQVENYKALLSGYQTFATAYKTIIDGELAKVEAFRGQIAAEQAKADVNRTLVEQFKASIEGSLAVVEVYKAQVDAAKVLVELEGTKIGAAGEQIKAYVAQINAETAKVEAYKAGVEAETSKIEAYRVKAQAFAARVQAQAEEARLQLGAYEAKARVKSLEWDGYRARVDAERSRMQALAAQSGALVDGYRAAATATEAEANMHARIWETQIREYEASQNITLQTARVNNEAVMNTNAIRLDAAKVGAQVYAQLTASAYSMINASAQIQGSGSTSVSYSYSNDTTSAVTPLTTA